MMGSKTHRMVALPGLPATVGPQAAVPRSEPEGPAMLTVDTGGVPRRVPVLARRLTEVPEGVVALPETLFDELGLGDAHQQWSLSPQQAVDATKVVLELASERSPEAAARDLSTGGIAGTLLLAANDQDQWLEISGASYRVRSTEAGRGGDALVRIGRQTDVELYVPGVRAGVDMVILADISDSMKVDDIPATGESMLALRAKTPYVRRIDALRQALHDLLNVRLQVSGRVSRVALLAFNTMTFPKFPADGGMVELDGDSPRHVINSYEKAVEQLQPYGSTRIEVALHAAAELLYRHGHPHNERLIVLVSDGAQWNPGRDDDTGRVFEALAEPISLMEHLHRDMNVRLHAIGISTRELFLRQFRDAPGLTPDHRLLERLVRVGGGDPATIGGLDALVEYFSSVGGGMTHRVRGPLSAAPALSLSPAAARTLAEAGLTAAAAKRQAPVPDRAPFVDEIGRADERIEAACRRLFPDPLWTRSQVARATLDLDRALARRLDTDALVRRLVSMFNRLRPTNQAADRMDCVRSWTALLDRLIAPLQVPPPDVAGFAAVVRSAGSTPEALGAAVLRQLAHGLTTLATALELAPAPEASRPKAAAVPAQQPRSGRIDRTEPKPVPGELIGSGLEMKG